MDGICGGGFFGERASLRSSTSGKTVAACQFSDDSGLGVVRDRPFPAKGNPSVGGLIAGI